MAEYPKGMHRTASGDDLPYLEVDGVRRVLAALPPRHDFGGFRAYSAVVPVMPRSEWREVSFGDDVPISDQGQHGSCVGHGSWGAFTAAWLQGGGTKQDFSPVYVYGCINGGRDSGAVVSDALDSLQKRGICLASTVPEGHVFHSQYPPTADSEATRFKVGEAYRASTFDELMTAIQLFRPVVFGIDVGGRFGNLDSDGFSPAGGFGGHCLYGRGAKKTAKGRWGIKTPNSWGTRWGLNGISYLGEEFFGGNCDAFVIETVEEDPQETRLPNQA